MVIQSVNPHIQAWINDQLDLYNYAKQIDDTEWQQAIVLSLANKASYNQQQSELDLWRKFDTINVTMLQLFEQLKTNKSTSEESVLREKVWALKLQRVEVSKKIKTKCG